MFTILEITTHAIQFLWGRVDQHLNTSMSGGSCLFFSFVTFFGQKGTCEGPSHLLELSSFGAAELA